MKKRISLILFLGLTSAFADNENYNGQDVSGQNFSNRSLINSSWVGANATAANFANATLTDADFTDAIIEGANLSGTTLKGFTQEQLYSTASYQNKDLSGVYFGTAKLNGWDFSEQDLTGATFGNVKLQGTDFTAADLRGATILAGDGTPIFRTTIMWDYGGVFYGGIIENFSMVSSDDVLVIRRYWHAPESSAVSAKISGADAMVSGGAAVVLDAGAELEVIDHAFTIASDGNLIINTDAGSSTLLSVESGSGLAFENGAVLRVNVEGEFAPSESEAIVIMSWADGSHITGTDVFTVDETIFLTVNGEAYAGDWNYKVADNQFQIVFAQIPEPAFWAAVLGLVALAFALRRRKQ